MKLIEFMVMKSLLKYNARIEREITDEKLI